MKSTAAVKFFATALFACGALAANSAGFDGMTLVTNDWFDASFTSLAVDTTIATNTTTGVTRGAGSWTEAPTNGTATIVADAEAGGGATFLSLNAPGEMLKFTPASLSTPSGMETVTAEVKIIPVDGELPVISAGAQGAFTLKVDGEGALTVHGQTSEGWTNLVYAAAQDLTNGWVTVAMDFATVSNVRYVRYSVTVGGSRTVLEDSDGTAWFPAGGSATTVTAVGFSGVGNIRSFSGDSLAEPVATCNGVNYATVADAIAAAEENGTVTLVKATSSESIAVTKNITINGGGNSNYQLNVSSLEIATGKTITFNNFAAQNTIGAITGGGNIETSGNRTFRLKISGTNYTIGEIALGTTQGIRVEGEGTMTVSKLFATASSVLDAFDGAQIMIGEVDSDSNITVSLKLVNATAMTKRGFGTLTFAGVAAPTAGFVVEGGSVIIDNSMDGISPYVWVDASDESTITETDGKVTEWASLVNGHSYTNESSAMTYVAAEGVFGGKKVVRTNNSQLQAEFTGDKVQSAVAAIRYYSNSATGAILYKKNVSNNYIGKRNSGNNYWSCLRTSSTAVSLWQNGGTSDIRFRTYETVLSVAGYYNGSATIEQLGGTSGDIAIAEFVGFNTTDTECPVRKRTEAYIGNKWSISGMVSLPSSVPLTLAGGTTFGLMGLDRTVDSVTVTGTGAATVTGGALTITAPVSVSVGQTLVIPYGSTYTLASGTGATVDATAGTVTIKHCAADIDGVVYDTVAGAIEAYASGTLTIHESADLDFGMTEVNVAEVVLDEGVVLTFTQNAPWMTEYDRDAGTIVNTRVASTYVWTPGENETAWSTLSNWSIGEATPIALPGASDTVLFPGSEEQEFTGWTVALAADVYATNLVVNGDMKFSGGLIHTGNVGGNGTITLNGNAGFHTYDWEQANLQVTNNLVITGTGNKFQTQGSKSYMNGGSIEIQGKVIGDGEITTVGKRSRVRFYGDWTEFSGTVTAQDDDVPRHALRLMAAQASSSNAVWNVWMSNESSGDSAFLDTSTTSYSDADTYHYYFGALNGRITIYQKYNNTLEIGALNQDCAFSGSIAATHRNHIKKVGSATLTFSGSGLGRLEVAGGVFASGNNSAIPNERITFSGEGGFFDPTTNTVDFAAKLVNSTEAPIGLYVTNNLAIGEIPDSNTGGLVKKGDGTLTLTAEPLYKGDTYLEGGMLKIPATWTGRVKTNVQKMGVYKSSETIGDVVYTVYWLGKLGSIAIIY